MKAATALDPSTHLGDAQGWLIGETKEDVVMKTDTRVRGGGNAMRAENVQEFELMRDAEMTIVSMTGKARSRKQARHMQSWTNLRQCKELKGRRDAKMQRTWYRKEKATRMNDEWRGQKWNYDQSYD